MSIWSRFTDIVGKIFGAEPPPQPRKISREKPGVSRTTPTPFQRPEATRIERGRPKHRRYGEVWNRVYDDLERSLPDTAISEFNEREARFRALYDVWSDPGESDDMQLAAYEEFWDDMADFGYSVADFDWSDFKQKYESLGG
jgi:hypothetical protein